MLALELVEERALLRAGELGRERAARASRNHAPWRARSPSASPRASELLGRVGRGWFEDLEARVAVGLDTPDQALVREVDQAVDDVHAELAGRPADRLGRVEVDPPSKTDRRSSSRRCPLVEEVVAPGDGAAERLLALGQVARAGGEERQLVLEPRPHRVRREELDPGRRELDGQRHAVQPRGDRRDRRRVLVRDPEIGPDGDRAGDEQPDRLERGEGRDVDRALLGRQARQLQRRELAQVRRRRQPRDRVLLLARDAERRRATSRATDRPGASRRRSAMTGPASSTCSKLSRTSRTCLPAATPAGPSSALRAPVSASPMPTRSGTRRGPARGPSRGHEEDPVGVALGRVRRDLQREPRLAGPARAGERDEPVGREQAPASASSRSRPTNDVSWVGRLLGRASSERSGGNSIRSPSATTWHSGCGSRRSLRRWLPSPRSEIPSPRSGVDEDRDRRPTRRSGRHGPPRRCGPPG